MLLVFSHPFPPCLFLLKNIDCRARSRFPLAVWVSRNTEEIHSHFTFYLPTLSAYYLPGCANLEWSVVDICHFFLATIIWFTFLIWEISPPSLTRLQTSIIHLPSFSCTQSIGTLRLSQSDACTPVWFGSQRGLKGSKKEVGRIDHPPRGRAMADAVTAFSF